MEKTTTLTYAIQNIELLSQNQNNILVNQIKNKPR